MRSGGPGPRRAKGRLGFSPIRVNELRREVDFDIGASTTVKFRCGGILLISRLRRPPVGGLPSTSASIAESFAQRYASEDLYDREGIYETKRLKRTRRLANRMPDDLESCENTL